MKNLIRIKQVEESDLGFGRLEMPKLKDLKINRPTSSQNIALSGIIRPNFDDVILGSDEQNWFKRLQNDDADLTEFKIELNDEEIEYGDETKL